METPPFTYLEARGPAQKPATILLVDDDQRNLNVLESILSSPELRLVRVQTAEEALLSVINNDITCIVLDIHLPTMSGLDLARLIKTRKRNQHIPIIFLTAYFLEEKDILQGYDVGAVDYLTKPFTPRILKSKVEVFVELYRKTQALLKANEALEFQVEQRNKAEEALRKANSELELRVQERTADLSEANQELQRAEKRYREVVHGLPIAVYVCDADGRITLYNQAAVALWGNEPVFGHDLWCGAAKLFRLDGTPLPADQSPMATSVKEGRAVRGEEILIERPDGTRCNVVPSPEPLRDESGKVIGAVNMLLDITERKRAEKAARQLAAIVESSDDAIISIDLTGKITSWNRGAKKLFGYSSVEVAGKPVTILIPAGSNEEELILERIRNDKVVEHYETVRRRRDGSLVEISLTVSPIKDAKGTIVGASKIARDISKENLAKRELEKAHAEVLAASRAKDDFLATLSHELRTPLNPVLLVASDAANNPELPPEVRGDFEMIRKNVELEARLIDDLLDITGVIQGKLTLRKQAVDGHAILRDAIANVRNDAEQKKIIIKLDFGAPKTTIFGDAVRLQQVFWNVLRNAVKFTPEGGRIIVETRQLPDPNHFSVKVSDNGIGMKTAEIERIFNPFAQGDHATAANSNTFGGLGLGLAISRKLIELHDGSIGATSEGPGLGSAFIIELPLSKPVENPVNGSSRPDDNLAGNLTPAKTARTSTPIRVLLVEDHEPTRVALAHLLQRRHYDVMPAASVAEARSLISQHTFDFLISDIGLPDGNGYELMTEFRERFNFKGIALTGYGMEQDIARSEAAGFVAHLTKPVRVQSLEAALASALKNFKSHATA